MWVLSIAEWVTGEYLMGCGLLVDDWISMYDHWYKRSHVRYIILDLPKTTRVKNIDGALCKLTPEERKSLYFCKKSLQASEMLLKLQSLSDPK